MALNFLNDGYFAGKVGIGTVSPLGKLHVKHVGEIYTSLAGSDSAINFLEIQGNPWRIGNRAADDSFRFAQSSDSLGTNVRVTFANGGNVGIGTVSPSELLELKPASGADSKINILKSDGTQKALIGYDNANGGLINLYNEAGTRNVVVRGYGDSYFNAGNVGIGTTNPSTKLEVVDTFSVQRTSADNEGLYVTVGGSDANAIIQSFYQEDSLSQFGYRKRYDGSTNLYQEFIHNNSSTGTEVYRVDRGTKDTSIPNGNVGIGTTSPDSLLHVSADVSGANAGIITIEGRPAGFLGDDIAAIDFHNNGSKRADVRMERGNTANDSQLVFSTSDTGTLNDALIINEAGAIQFNTYGAGTLVTDASGNITVSSGGGAGGPFLPLAGGTMTAGAVVTFLDSSSATDDRLKFGAGGDLQIYHDASSSYVDQTGTGKLILNTLNTGINIQAGSGETRFTKGGQNSNVKIDDASQNNKIVLNSVGSSYFNGGNVGIGTTTPGAKLEVVSARGAEGIHLNDGSFPTVGKVMLDVDANGDGEITLKNSNSALTSVISGGESSYLMGGNVGIGTASPQSKLQIESTGEALRFTRSGQETYRVIHGTSGLYFTAPNAGNLLFGITQNSDVDIFNTSGSIMFRADGSTSNIGIGTTSPGYTLDVQNNNNIVANFQSTTNKGAISVRDDDTVAYISAENGRIGFGTAAQLSTSNLTMLTSNNNIGIGTISPSAKLNVVGTGTQLGTTGYYYNAFFKDTTNSGVYLGGNNTNDGVGFLAGVNQLAFLTWSGSNWGEKMRITGAGGISFGSTGTAYGTSGQILKSNGNASPTWIDGSAIPGVPGGSGAVNYIPKWTPDGDTLGNSAMFQSGNNISLGITTPNARLSVVSDISIGTSGTDVLRLHNESGVGTIDGYSTRNLAFGSATNGEVVRIDNVNGRVGIGTTSPAKKLNVYGDVLIESSGIIASLYFRPSATYGAGGIQTMKVTGSGNPFHTTTSFSNYTADNVLNIVHNNVGIGTTTPVAKLHVEGNKSYSTWLSRCNI